MLTSMWAVQHCLVGAFGPGPASFTTAILTEAWQMNLASHSAGCTIAILVENAQVYFAHIRPRQSTPSDPRLLGQTTRNDLAQNMNQIGGFDGIGVTDPRHYIVYGGNAVNEVQ